MKLIVSYQKPKLMNHCEAFGFLAESFQMFREEKKRWWSINKYGRLINYRYVKNRWKLINEDHFKDGSENVVFEFSMAHKICVY